MCHISSDCKVHLVDGRNIQSDHFGLSPTLGPIINVCLNYSLMSCDHVGECHMTAVPWISISFDSWVPRPYLDHFTDLSVPEVVTLMCLVVVDSQYKKQSMTSFKQELLEWFILVNFKEPLVCSLLLTVSLGRRICSGLWVAASAIGTV